MEEESSMKLSDKKPTWKTWLLSPYLLYIGLAALVIWYVTNNADTHYVPEQQERGLVTLNESFSRILPGDTEPTVFPAGKQFELLGRLGQQWILEDPQTGLRFTNLKSELGECELSGNEEIVNRLVNTGFHSYVKADSYDDVFVGRNINDVVSKVGDYTEANPEKGYYWFKYLVPLVGKERNESGLVLTTDPDGVIVGSNMKKPEASESNKLAILPFYSTITSWNLLTHGVNNLYETVKPEKEKGFFATIFGWIFGLIWGLCKFVLLLGIILLIFFLPATAILAITGPMVKMKAFSSTQIMLINLAFVVPLEYILFVSFADYFHSASWIAIPIFLVIIVGVMAAISDMTVGRRCPKCGAVDSNYTESKMVDVRVSTHQESYTHEDPKLKYKGVSMKTMDHTWEQDVSHRTYFVTVTETDYQDDTYCRCCDYHRTSIRTEKKKSRELAFEDKEKRKWVPK